MAETHNTAEQAEILASDLFSEFFWNKLGPSNHDWPCEDADRHKVKEHPCDVVYYYDEPYAARQTYVHCDLKSYAKGTITAAAVRSAVESLAKQVSCAEKSETWRKLHTHENVTFSVDGLLFVYNHDGEYEADFQKNLVHIPPESLQLPRGSRLFVLGPKEIFWLNNIRDEIQRLRGKRSPEIPGHEHCFYFHPQLVRRANLQVRKAKAATLETLTLSSEATIARSCQKWPLRGKLLDRKWIQPWITTNNFDSTWIAFLRRWNSSACAMRTRRLLATMPSS